MGHENIGERRLQAEMGTSGRARQFYDRQMRSSLSEKMVSLVSQQEMVFVATSDAQGNCDCSPRFGSPGFVLVLDNVTLAYPEFRGNGVYASLGNILVNPHIGLVFVDFFDTTVGLHVNGEARSCLDSEKPEFLQDYLQQNAVAPEISVERWVIVTVEEAYIHCSKHVPLLKKMSKQIDWGTDDPAARSSSYFTEDTHNPTQAVSHINADNIHQGCSSADT